MKKNKWYLGGFLIVIILIIIFVIINRPLPINKDEWQAVFLTNNQVYFGKLSSFDKSYLKLTKVYYLQSDQSISKETADLNLIKLGAEIHGPEDMMYISKSQVLFWENLKADSRIVKIISDYKSN